MLLNLVSLPSLQERCSAEVSKSSQLVHGDVSEVTQGSFSRLILCMCRYLSLVDSLNHHSVCSSVSIISDAHTHTHTHACNHARMHARTHARTHARIHRINKMYTVLR